jgi:SAM-dependent methyltransferase
MSKIGAVSLELFTVVTCVGCGHVYTNPRVADEDLGKLYDDEYYAGRGFDSSINYDAPPSDWTRAENAAIVKTVSSALLRPLNGARWLEVGCGSGTLLEAILEAGADGFGFDDSSAAQEKCRSRSLPMLTRAEVELQRGTFDVVSAIQVIEHVPDPVDFIRYLSSLTKPGGVIFVHTENWNVVRRLPSTPYIMPEGHIQYFTPASMRRLFKMCGIQEVPVFNRVWFVWRRLPDGLRRLVPTPVLTMLRGLLLSIVPGYATFPVGRKPPT